MTRVHIVDDDEAVRDSIAELVASVGLESSTYPSAQAFLEGYDAGKPGCLVLDVRMAHMSGPALQERLVAMGARIPIVFVSGHGDIPVAIATIKAGAVDFVQKPYQNQQLLDSINEALRKDAASRDASRASAAFEERRASLTDREREVLIEIAAGATNAEIATTLYMAEGTVKTHIGRLLAKLHIRDRVGLVLLAYETGLVRR